MTLIIFAVLLIAAVLITRHVCLHVHDDEAAAAAENGKEARIAFDDVRNLLRSCTETEPIELRKQYINTGAVAVYIALKPGGDGIEIAYIDDDDPEFNSLQADELIEAMTRAKSDYLLTTVRNK